MYNLDDLYRGFDDPQFPTDLQHLEQLLQELESLPLTSEQQALKVVILKMEEIQEEVVLPHKQQVGKSTTDDAHRHAEPEYALHTLHLPRAVILPDKTDCSAIERHDNEIAVEFKVQCRRRACHRACTIGVDC